MNMVLERFIFAPTHTIGRLKIGGEFQAWTLEDTERPPGVKVPGDTAIPEGNYSVVLTRSQRFQRVLPLLLGVKGFEGIRIHAGNSHQDTEGCILVGLDNRGTSIGRSRTALDRLMARLMSLPQHETIALLVTR